MLYGGRVSLQVGFLSIGLAVVVSVPLGLLAGYFGGLLDNAVMRIMDLILAFPGLILAIWLVSLLGANMVNVIIAIAFFSLPTYARLIRGINAVHPRDGVCCGGAGHGRELCAHHVFPYFARCAGTDDCGDDA